VPLFYNFLDNKTLIQNIAVGELIFLKLRRFMDHQGHFIHLRTVRPFLSLNFLIKVSQLTKALVTCFKKTRAKKYLKTEVENGGGGGGYTSNNVLSKKLYLY
jgi:hypothetical protein